MRKTLFIFFISILVITSCTKEKELSSIMNAVPIDASIIIEIPKYNEFAGKLQSGSDYWTELKTFPEFKSLNESIVNIDSLIRKNIDFKTAFFNKKVVISAHAFGKNEVSFLYVMPNNATVDYNKIIAILNIKDSDVIKNIYDGINIYTVKDKKEKHSFSFISGVILFSKSQLLVEKSIRQIKAGASLLNKNSFSKIALTAGANVDANLYINPNFLPQVLKKVLNGSTLNYLTNNSPFIGQTELDFSIKKNEVLLNGFSNISDSLNHYSNIFTHQKSINFDIEEVLPANTSMFLMYGISEKLKFQSDYKLYIETSNNLVAYNKTLSTFKSKYKYNLEKEFYSFLEEEFALAYTDINKLNIYQNAFAIFKTSSKSMAKDKLSVLLNAYAGVKGVETTELITNYNIDDETSYEIYNLPLNIPQTLFGNLFSRVNGEYYTFVNNYVIFGNSIKSLSEFIHDNVLHKTLENNITYNRVKDRVSSDANINLYVNLPIFYDVINTYLSDDLRNKLDKNTELMNKFQAFVYQSSKEKNLMYNTIYIKYNPIFKDKPRTIWESKLDTTIEFKPKIFINHRTKKKEIFVQDLNNTIYLINNSGRILWKKNIREKIIGKIYQIDLFKNEKLQYLFNTASKIHLIDRNGNYVERYPILLPYKATCGLGLFDYDKSRDYRILIADEDKNVKLYNGEGNVLEGWEFEKTDTYVKTKPQHYRIDDKDYIIFADSLKTYILDRKGHTRVDVKTFFAKAKNSRFYMNLKTETHGNRLITTDINGQIIFIYFDGTVKTFKFDNFSNSHYFLYKDIDGDFKYDYIFADGNKIIAYNYKKEEILSYTFDGVISTKPSYYQFPDNVKKLGITIKDLNQIYLLSNDGELHKGFPLKGSTSFSIARFKNIDSEFNLIVGSDNEFLFNYKVN